MSAERRRGAALALGLSLLALLGTVSLGSVLLSIDPLTIRTDRILSPPSLDHPLGTDQLGRDLLSRLLAGGRPSFLAGLVATAMALTLGVGLGTLASRAPIWLDTLLSRGTDLVYAFPALIGAMVLIGLPESHPFMALPQGMRVGLVVGLFSWPMIYRFVRLEVRRQLGSDRHVAALAAGAGPLRALGLHLLPQALAPALVPASFIAGSTILVEAALGFLGLGVRPPEPSWGNLLRDGMAHVDSAWWMVLFPGLAVFLAVLAFQLIGEGLARPRAEGIR
ncbi:MAG: ABC transporter permease [Acidobacteriota bacterium]|nr:ABC transporter permease [Acidobacteriota bacterium]